MPPSNRRLGLSMLAIALGMVMLAYASVPLYRLFCQVTGYGGTTQENTHLPGKVLVRRITVRFNADIDPTLPWKFRPNQNEVTVQVGQQNLVSYHAENEADLPLTGRAVYNVTPHKAGAYFDKIACFCFKEQTLAAHQKVQMPVSFFIDPSIQDDPEMQDVDTITLSYTFFPVKK